MLIVVNDPKAWPLHIPGVEVIDARTYLTDAAYGQRRGIKVFNLCRSCTVTNRLAITSRSWLLPGDTVPFPRSRRFRTCELKVSSASSLKTSTN